MLKRYGVEIKSTSEYFEDTPAGRFMENIIANVAQFDNDVRAERSSGGMRDAVREGRYVWMAPYGYSNVKVLGKATIAPNTFASLVFKAFEEVALNKYPTEEVRKKLIAEGLVNASQKPISKSYFYHLLRNELYTGWITKFGERHKGSFEPLISEELFHRVQHVLSIKHGKNKQYLVHNPDFPLRRFITHPTGQMLTGCWSKGRDKKYPYYMFHKRNINIKKEVLETVFKGWLNQFKMDDTYFEKLEKYVKLRLDKGIEDKKSEVERLQKQVVDLKAKQTALIEKNINDIISDELCRERIAAIDNQLYEINKTITNLPKATINYSRVLSIIRNVLLNPGEVWEKVNFSEKIKLQWFYFPHGIEFDGFESRTIKICKLFKVKQLISPLKSYKVHHPNSKSNTTNWQVLKVVENKLDIQEDLFWPELGEELVTLSELTNKPVEKSSQYPALSVAA